MSKDHYEQMTELLVGAPLQPDGPPLTGTEMSRVFQDLHRYTEWLYWRPRLAQLLEGRDVDRILFEGPYENTSGPDWFVARFVNTLGEEIAIPEEIRYKLADGYEDLPQWAWQIKGWFSMSRPPVSITLFWKDDDTPWSSAKRLREFFGTDFAGTPFEEHLNYLRSL